MTTNHNPVRPSHRPRETKLTVEEVAQELRVSKMTAYRLIHRKELPALKIGRNFRVLERDLDAFIRAADTIGWTHLEGEE